MRQRRKISLAVLGLLVLAVVMGSLGALTAGSDIYSAVVLLSSILGLLYGFVAMTWILED